jgi:hypothetical protein
VPDLYEMWIALGEVLRDELRRLEGGGEGNGECENTEDCRKGMHGA